MNAYEIDMIMFTMSTYNFGIICIIVKLLLVIFDKDSKAKK